MKIKDIPIDNRPMERMITLGFNVLSDAEVLAIILQKGTRSENVIDVSNRLIAKYELSKLTSLSLPELMSVNGIGRVKAMQILAAFELGKRVKIPKLISISCAKDVFERFNHMKDLKQEHFVVVLLDCKNKIIKEETVFIGTVDSALIHPREIFKSAIKESASAIILVHNHPSGDCEPSEQDLIITGAIISAGKTLGIKVIDHVIISKENFWSRGNRANYNLC